MNPLAAGALDATFDMTLNLLAPFVLFNQLEHKKAARVLQNNLPTIVEADDEVSEHGVVLYKVGQLRDCVRRLCPLEFRF